MRHRYRFAAVLLAATLAAGCEDPLAVQQPTIEGTVVLYSLARPELVGLPAGFSFSAGARVVVEDDRGSVSGGETGWSIVFTEDADGTPVLATPNAFNEQLSGRVAIATIENATYEEVTEAPEEDAFVTDEVVVLDTADVYVIRVPGTLCSYHAKMDPVEFDADAGTLEFDYLFNPNCSDGLEPVTPDGDEEDE